MKGSLSLWFTLGRAGLVAAAAALLAGAAGRARAAANPARSRKPNILLILADDMGWRDLGCCGSTFHQTPHLDALARQGMRFINAYAAAAVCSPTRASLLTGKYPARLHLTHIIQAPRTKKGSLEDPDWTPYLPLDEVTLAKALKPAGYVTALIGKWHLGGVAGRSGSGDGAEGEPKRQGFAVNVAGSDLGQPPDYFFPYSRSLSGGKTVRLAGLGGGRPGEYLTDRLTAEAERFVTQHRGRPFFLFLSHFAPHTAMGDRLQAPGSVIARFKAKVNPKDPQHNVVYAAMVASLDDGVGRLLRKLDDLGLAGNTLVIFTSDNGGVRSKTSNLPLRGEKGTPYEGGLRVPALIRWPGKVKPGSISDTPIISPDFYPTVLEAAGVKVGPRQVVDGLSLVPLLTGAAPLKRPALYWHFPHCDPGPYSAVRRGGLKLIEFIGDGRYELYNLREDKEEKTNLAGRMPTKLASLRRDLARWRESVGAQMPTRLPARSAPRQR
jgi:arylsulfatase A-like enzyme